MSTRRYVTNSDTEHCLIVLLEHQAYAGCAISALTVCLRGYSAPVEDAKNLYLNTAKSILEKVQNIFSLLWHDKQRVLFPPRTGIPPDSVDAIAGPLLAEVQSFSSRILLLSCDVCNLRISC